MKNECISMTGVGSYLPEQVVYNHEIPGFHSASEMYSKFWSTVARRRMQPDESLTDMGIRALTNAMKMAGIEVADLDIILVGSSNICEHESVDSRAIFPRLATRIRNRIGAQYAVALDIEAGCASFVVGLDTAVNYLKVGRFRRAAVVTIDAFSRILDSGDPSGMIFGDGSGAAIIERMPCGYGYIHSTFESDSTHYSLAGVKWKLPRQGGGCFKPYFYVDTSLKMAEFVPKLVPRAIRNLLQETGIQKEDVELFFLHQPGRYLIEQWKKELGLSVSKAPDVHRKYACLSSSSVIVTLDEMARENKLKSGDFFVMAGVGIGWLWGAHIWQWSGPTVTMSS